MGRAGVCPDVAALRALPLRPAEHHEPRTVEQVRQALDVARASPKSFLTATDYRQLRIDLLENELQELEAVHAQAN